MSGPTATTPLPKPHPASQQGSRTAGSAVHLAKAKAAAPGPAGPAYRPDPNEAGGTVPSGG